MKTRYIIAFAAATLMLAGCQMDSLKENYGNIGRPILYSVSEDVCGDSNLTVRSYVAVPDRSAEELFILRSDGNGSVITMRLDCESAEGFSGLKRSYASTKGALVNTSDGEKAMEGYADIVGSVVVSAFKGADEVITDETVSWNATKGKWLAENEHFWNPGDNLCFFSWGNLPTSDYVNVNCTKDALSLSYTQPSDPSAQTDIVLGTYSGDGGTTGTAELKFNHPLTAVIFKEGDLAGKKVKSIRLSGLASDGKVSVTTDGTIGDWQNISGYNAVSLQSSDGDDGLSVDATTKVIGEPFIIIPQATASRNVKITVELTDGTCLVNTQSSAIWKAQKSSIYILNWQGVLVESITLNKTETTLDPEETDNLSVSEYLPDNATRKSVTWASSDPSVATVDASTGAVTAIAGGTATITATAIDAGKKTAACTVNVNTKVSGISFDKSSMTLDNRTKATGTIVATVTPAEATLQTLTWTSSDNGVATVSNGVVTPVANGTATITAKTTDGTNKSADCTVTVKTSLTGVTVSPNTTKTIYTNATPNSFAITPTNNPTTASIASLSWTSDNSGVATVSNGTVSAVANGNCTITYSATDAFGNTKTATCPVNVQTKVTGISHNLVNVTLNMNESGRTFTASVQPDNATNKKIIWSSSNPSKVSVDQNGNVKALENSGSATITAKTEDGGYSASCTVTCYVPVTSVSLSQPQGINIIEGSNTGHRSHSVTLTATVSPLNATNKNVSWKSSSSSASVSSGTVTGGVAGNATITVTTEDGGKTASYDITVTNYNSKAYVDFGLPSGNVWRTCNVGAGNPSECGWFITPGETGFRGATAPFDFQYLRDYGYWGGSEASGRVPDGWNPPSSSYSTRDARYFSNGVLKPDDDVAHKHENGSWRMPTTAEYMELVDGTDHYWTTYNNIPGMMFKGKGSYSTQTMFIPAWGNIDGVTFEERGNQGWNLTFGYYWAADSSGAWAKVFAFFGPTWGDLANKLQISYCPVAYGCLVRAVSK